MAAVFVIGEGLRILVPSYIYTERSQHAMIEAAGLSLLDTGRFMRSSLGEESVSPKILALSNGDFPVVTGYVAQKASEQF